MRRGHREDVRQERQDEGFVLLVALVMVFLVLLALTVAAPSIAKSIQRDREVEATHRANQYVRAIRVYYKKFGHYPGSVDQLEKSNNQRFLRQKYLDPLTGKDDWRLIHVGDNKTTVKGFFGQDLPGLAGGLGAAAGLSSSGTNNTTGTSSNSAFNNSGSNSTGGNSSFGSNSSFGGSSSSSGSSTTGSTSSGSGTGSGISSQDATSASGSGGPIMGIGSSKSGEAMVTVNEQTNYQDWEFLYDPRIEQLYAKGSLLGGAPSAGLGSSGTSTPSSAFPPIGGSSTSTPSPTTPTTTPQTTTPQ